MSEPKAATPPTPAQAPAAQATPAQDQRFAENLERVGRGGAPKYHAKNAESGKLFARDRIAKLCDAGSFIEDARLANALDPDLPADGVVIGTATIDGRRVAIMANDSTVKAGSWGARTVE